jgi:hypothetical protein
LVEGDGEDARPPEFAAGRGTLDRAVDGEVALTSDNRGFLCALGPVGGSFDEPLLVPPVAGCRCGWGWALWELRGERAKFLRLVLFLGRFEEKKDS